jgi:ATP-dependent protease HslVU (ClpYQ) ATPase subunit
MNNIEEEYEKQMTPKKIKEELDKVVIGQDTLKRSIAVSLRERYRKRILLRSKGNEYIRSHNMLIAGKSGSGKTEIVKQTAKLCNSPFIKVEAVRYTEVGYHGDDVENIVVDLYKKSKHEFHKNLKTTFWKLKSVKKSWEHFVFSFLLGKSYDINPSFRNYQEKLHNGDLDNMDINVWYYDLDRMERFKISDIKNYFYTESLDKISNHIDLDEIIRRNIEDRGIICVDEFDKLINQVDFINIEK